jgi:hypothetical protein
VDTDVDAYRRADSQTARNHLVPGSPVGPGSDGEIPARNGGLNGKNNYQWALSQLLMTGKLDG